MTYEKDFLSYLKDYENMIYKVARSYTSDQENIQDLIQDIILQLWKAFDKYDGSASKSTWTYRIAMNVAISSLRKANTRSRTSEGYASESVVSIEEGNNDDERIEQLYHCIEDLNPIDRAVVILLLEGCKNNQIAEIIGISVSNVSTRIHRVKDVLKICFDKKMENHGL